MFADNRFGYLDQVRYSLGYVTTPIYWVADTPTRVSFWIDDVLVSRTDLIEENEYLREQLLLSQRQLQLLESLASENSRLRALQDSAETIDGKVLPAEIINVSPDPLSKRIMIDKGARHGVFVGQALLDANGLMGQVDEVLPYTSWVLLITDSHHVTPVEVNRNGERALARGSRNGASELELEFVTQTQDIMPGDLLVSSGMGQVYPKDYPVAEVISVYQDPGQPYLIVKARPLAQIDSTRNVMLIFKAGQAPPGVNLQSQPTFLQLLPDPGAAEQGGADSEALPGADTAPTDPATEPAALTIPGTDRLDRTPDSAPLRADPAAVPE